MDQEILAHMRQLNLISREEFIMLLQLHENDDLPEFLNRDLIRRVAEERLNHIIESDFQIGLDVTYRHDVLDQTKISYPSRDFKDGVFYFRLVGLPKMKFNISELLTPLVLMRRVSYEVSLAQWDTKFTNRYPRWKSYKMIDYFVFMYCNYSSCKTINIDLSLIPRCYDGIFVTMYIIKVEVARALAFNITKKFLGIRDLDNNQLVYLHNLYEHLKLLSRDKLHLHVVASRKELDENIVLKIKKFLY